MGAGVRNLQVGRKKLANSAGRAPPCRTAQKRRRHPALRSSGHSGALVSSLVADWHDELLGRIDNQVNEIEAVSRKRCAKRYCRSRDQGKSGLDEKVPTLGKRLEHSGGAGDHALHRVLGDGELDADAALQLDIQPVEQRATAGQ